MTETTGPLVSSETVAAVTTVTLDSPHNRNALSGTLVAELSEALAEAAADPEVRAVVLTHTGGTFCAGADLTEALSKGLSPEQATSEASRAMVALIKSILELPKPVVAVVNGHVRAGGFGLLGAADIALAGPESTFALTEARLGLAPSIISTVLLPKMSARAAGRYFVTGEKFYASTAEQIGLIGTAADSADALRGQLLSILDGIRKASPQGLAASKALTTASILDGFDELAGVRAAESAGLFASEEARAGMTAYLSKQRAPWDISVPDAGVM